MHNFRELLVWQKSMELVTKFYKVSMKFPQSEIYGLTSQMKRSSISVPSNIAEGAGRNSKEQFSHFLNIALGSAFEFECQIEIALNLNFINQDDFDELNNELRHIQNMIIKLNQSLN